MSGFASGFESGFGLVSQDLDRRRRAKLESEQLEIQRQRNADLDEYRKESLGLQRDAARATERDRMRRRALEATALVNESDEILRQTGLDRAARARQQEIDARNRELHDLEVQTARTQGEAQAIVLRQQKRREALERAVGGLSGNGSVRGAAEALAELEGSGMSPLRFVGPEAGRKLRVAQDFSSGKRSDFGSEDFIEAVDFVMKPDTALMRGMVAGNRGIGEIQDMRVVAVEPVQQEGGDVGVRMQVRVEAEGGAYTTYITRGRSTRADAEPAVIPLDDIMDRVAGATLSAEAVRDPNIRDQLNQWANSTRPEVMESVRKAADRAYRDDKKAFEEANYGETFPKTLNDYVDDYTAAYLGDGAFRGESDDRGELIQRLRAEAEAAGVTGISDEDLLRVYEEG